MLKINWVNSILKKIFSPSVEKNGKTTAYNIRIDSKNPELSAGYVTIFRLENEEQEKQWDMGYKAGTEWAVDHCKPDGSCLLPENFGTNIADAYVRGWREGLQYAASKISEKYWKQFNKISAYLAKKYAGIEYDPADNADNTEWNKHIKDFCTSQSCEEPGITRKYYKKKLIGIMTVDENYQWHLKEPVTNNQKPTQ